MVGQILDASQTNRAVVEAMIGRIFPHASRYLHNSYGSGESLAYLIRNRRVAHSDLLAFYFERVAGRSLRSFWSAERVLVLMSSPEEAAAYLQGIEPSEWIDVIHSLEAFEGEYPVEAVVPGSVVLLNLINQMPKREREVFNFLMKRWWLHA